MVHCTEKALIVVGDTREFRDALHEAGGKWIKSKKGPYGWMFSKRRIRDVATILGIEPVLTDG
jgi:hypothetical protein